MTKRRNCCRMLIIQASDKRTVWHEELLTQLAKLIENVTTEDRVFVKQTNASRF